MQIAKIRTRSGPTAGHTITFSLPLSGGHGPQFQAARIEDHVP